MRVILHDLPLGDRERVIKGCREDDYIIEKKGKDPVNCKGCFGCWIKTPGVCILKDGAELNGARLGAADEFIIITKCRYGEFSVFTKKIIDRCNPHIHPYFVKRGDGRTHHKLRYTNHVPIRVFFYGEDLSEEEIQCMKDRVAAMGINLGAQRAEAYYVPDISGGIAL